jgi:hypothetical protein
MEKFKSFAVKVMGMTDDEVAALYDADGKITEEAFDTLEQKDKERIRRLRDAHKEDLTAKFNEGHAKAKREERSKYEDEIRQTFGVDSKAMGVDLIKEVMAKGASGDVKTHPDYLQLEKKLKEGYVPKEDYDVIKSEFDGFKSKVERDTILSRVKADARSRFHSLNPVLSKDPKRAANQETEFLRKLESYDYQLQPDGNHVIIKDGKRLENDNMNPVLFDELVKDLTLAFFDVQTQDQKGNSGVTKTTVSTTVGFKDKEEFLNAYYKEDDFKKRAEMMKAAEAKGLV